MANSSAFVRIIDPKYVQYLKTPSNDFFVDVFLLKQDVVSH